jgi:putative nucleotidyltransferase with HDIG domain
MRCRNSVAADRSDTQIKQNKDSEDPHNPERKACGRAVLEAEGNLFKNILRRLIRVFARRDAAADKTPSLAAALQAREAETTTGTQDQYQTRGAEILESHQVETEELGPLAKLPPFAPVVMSLLRLFDRDDVTIESVANLVESDPAIASELLGVANSPLFGFRGGITSPTHAIALLGIERTKSLATALAMRSMMNGAPRTAVVRRLWIHSMATAAIAQEFAAAFGVPHDLAHIAAIMHDLGRMGLLAAHPTKYAQLALAAYNSEPDIRAEERAQFGMDHCHAGLLLARAWGLPEVLWKAAECHHEASARRDLVSLVHLGCRLADDLMFQAIRYEGPQDPVATIETCAPEALRGDLTDRLEAAKASALKMIESLDF